VDEWGYKTGNRLRGCSKSGLFVVRTIAVIIFKFGIQQKATICLDVAQDFIDIVVDQY
jgi:hypothetical protein